MLHKKGAYKEKGGFNDGRYLKVEENYKEQKTEK